jgi:hypothetical protein
MKIKNHTHQEKGGGKLHLYIGGSREASSLASARWAKAMKDRSCTGEQTEATLRSRKPMELASIDPPM